MADLILSLDGLTSEYSTRKVIQPHLIKPIQEEAGVDTPPVLPAPREEEQEEQPSDAQLNTILRCIMEDSRDPLHTFQEFESYLFLPINSESDSDVPEDDDLADEMEDISCDENQLVPVDVKEEEI